MRILLATNNAHKLEEMQAMLPSWVTATTPAEMGIVLEVDENADTLEGNAAKKALAFAKAAQMPCLADDTGLFVDALGGLPGVQTARYAGPSANSAANVDKLLGALHGVENRIAVFKTVLAYAVNGNLDVVKYFTGTVPGQIAPKPRGENGFGYDPVFVPEGHTQTFAELDAEAKHALSHRGRAMAHFADWLDEG